MSSVPPLTYPTLNPTPRVGGQPSATPLSAVEPLNINFMATLNDTSMDDGSSAHTAMYAPAARSHLPLAAYAKIESISDLVSADSIDFEYSHEMDAVLHNGKCPDCVQFGMHLIMPGNRAKFLKTTRAHTNAITEPLQAEIKKLATDAQTMSKTIGELKDALESSRRHATSLKEQRNKARHDYGELSVEHRALLQRVKDLEQRPTAAPYRHSLVRRHSPSRTGMRAGTPYERPGPQRPSQPPGRRPPAQASIILEPDPEGDAIMASLPAAIRPTLMHSTQPQYNNPRGCDHSGYRWRSESGIEMVGLPKTRAGTPYFPSEVGLGWYRLENGAASISQVYKRIDLLFRNRKTETWRAAARSVFNYRHHLDDIAGPMEYFLSLHGLRKSVWSIIDEGVANNASVAIASPGCRLDENGYAGLYTPDVQLWAVLHTAANVDSSKLTERTGSTATAKDLKKMLKDVICSGNFFELNPAEFEHARAEFEQAKFLLPRLAHYDGPLDPLRIGVWLRDTIGLSGYMVHAYFRPYLRRAHDAPIGERYSMFSPNHTYPGEGVAPTVDDSLPDFPEGCDWTPNRGPKGRLTYLSSSTVTGATASASPAPSTSHNEPPQFSIHSTPIDSDMAGNEEATASASPASS